MRRIAARIRSAARLRRIAAVGAMTAAVTVPAVGVHAGSAAAAGGPYPGQRGAVSQYVSASGTAMPADEVTINTGTARILAFVPWSPAPATPIVWWLHGHMQNYATMYASKSQMIDSWIARGWIVLSIDATADLTRGFKARMQEWGNEAIRIAAVDTYDWEQSLWPASPPPLIYGVSMGGLAAVNVAYEFGARGLPITAIAMNSGALNLRNLWNVKTARGSIRTNYRLSAVVQPGDPEWTAKIDGADGGHDVIVRGATGIDPSIPFRQYVGTKDTRWAPPALNAYAFDADLTAAGWSAEHAIVSCKCAHVAAPTYQPDDVNAFYDRALAQLVP